LFDVDAASAILRREFAPWVQDLDLTVASVAADRATLTMRAGPRTQRAGGVVCGQALMALADTAMVFAVAAASGGYRPMTTVDQTTHFMRAAMGSDVLAEARVIRLGRTMSFGRVTLSTAADNKPVAMVSSAFAIL